VKVIKKSKTTSTFGFMLATFSSINTEINY